MARPKNKAELQELAVTNFRKLLQVADEHEGLTFPQQFMNRNVRDVLAHIHHWHLMMLDWYKIGMSGEKPTMPAEGYTWKTLPDLNQEIHTQYENLPISQVTNMIKESHTAVIKLIESHSNEELFEKKRYKWTGTTSLGAYLISATSSHYDWGAKLIKKAAKG